MANGLRECCVMYAKEVILELGNKDGLSMAVSEAMELINWEEVSVVSKRSAAMTKVRGTKKLVGKKPSMTVPFCGVVMEDWCQGVRLNHGLHTQCMNGKFESSEYCKTCNKSAENSASSKPTYGDIRDRLVGNLLEYRDPTGRMTTCFANVAQKRNLDIGQAQEAAKAFGWEIPAEQLVVKVTKRGRPSTGKKVSKKVVKTSEEFTMEDQISKLVAEAADDVLSQSSKSSSSKKVKVKKAKVVKAKKSAEKAESVASAKSEKAEKLLAAKALKAESVAAAKAEKLAIKLAKQELVAAAKAEKAELAAAAKAEKAELAAAAKALKTEKLLAAKALKAEKLLAVKLAKKVASDALKAEKLAAKVAKKVASKEEAVVELTSESIEQLQKEISTEVDSSEDEEDDEIVLDDSTETIEIDGVKYFRTDAYGLGPNVLFTMEGEPAGLYEEETGEIQELEFGDE